MNVLSLRLPESLHHAANALANKVHISINLLIMLALAEKIAALETVDYLKARAKKSSRAKYLAVLNKAPNIKPDDDDKR